MRDDHRAAREVGVRESARADRGPRSRGRWSARRAGTRRSGRAGSRRGWRAPAWPPESAGISRSSTRSGRPRSASTCADPGIEVGGAEREVRVERVGVRVVGALVRRRRRRAPCARARRARCSAARDAGAARRGTRARSRPAAARAPAGGSRRVAVGGVRVTRPGVGPVDAGEDPQQRALAGAVRRDDADPAARADREVHAGRARRAARTTWRRRGRRGWQADGRGEWTGTRRHLHEESSGREGLGACRVATSRRRIARWTRRRTASISTTTASSSAHGSSARGTRARRSSRAARRRGARALRPRRLRLLGGGVPSGSLRRLPVRRRRARPGDVPHGDVRRLPARRRQLPHRAAHDGAVRVVGTRAYRFRRRVARRRVVPRLRSDRCRLSRTRECTKVDLRGARLDGVRGVGSLRGATIGVDQLFGLAPGLATAVGHAGSGPTTTTDARAVGPRPSRTCSHRGRRPVTLRRCCS